MAEEEHYITVTIGFNEAVEKHLDEIQRLATEWHEIIDTYKYQLREKMLSPDVSRVSDSPMTNSFDHLTTMLNFLELHFRRLWQDAFDVLHYTDGPKHQLSTKFKNQFGYTKNIQTTNIWLQILLKHLEEQTVLQRLLQHSQHVPFSVEDARVVDSKSKLRLYVTTT